MRRIGSYVLATKYSDGDPYDAWAVGFYQGEFKAGSETRHNIVDSNCNQFRHNGFRRVQHITHKEGDLILGNKFKLKNYQSVWHYLRELRR